jgi:hypothetical protein
VTDADGQAGRFGSLSRSLLVRLLCILAVIAGLASIAPASGAGSQGGTHSPAATTVSITAYDAAAQHPSATQSDSDRSGSESGTAIRGDSSSAAGFSAAQPVFVAAEDEAIPSISRQQQDGHIAGTPQYTNRIKVGKPTSSWLPGEDADALTTTAWQGGTPVPNNPNLRVYDAGRPIGRGAYGGTQSQIRVSINGRGLIHGTPWGPEVR